ncbi:SIMPL domain-containing protein [Sphingobium yanoikuyae]|uniref:SIMPL domain-containing protein n=1 Tax=Sphingobium yanoikuyae TaxID=13690 RepID=A0AA42WWV3_SPHYA|nr:SIMPL domain-containing protein [Sphingobium yanoikuyae]MDH2133265.1 SIMPL domain-containing protein [Sphingobium yanoikuyae]MDH2150396.1 SIMPL domain-containing protein [Sphingobium yanoikuyae]MDH2165553.1 SIMPL domain-containing protein [Sphingobium yanoikuyae]
MALEMRDKVLLGSAAVLAIGVIAGGYLLGDGLKRARAADRSVTVRGLAEKDVTADLATWSISYSATGTNLPTVRAEIDANTQELKAYFASLGFKPDALTPVGAGVNQYLNNGINNITITQRMLLRTTDIARAQRAVAQQFDLVRRGVTLQEGSGMRYSFTRLNDLKPPMVAAATRDARAAAEQFAKDSGAGVGGIKSATQGYFSIDPRDGEGGDGSSDTPYKKVRVVTTVDFYLK